MKYIDLHCDTLHVHQKKDRTGDLWQNDISRVDFKELMDAEVMGQCFAMYMPNEDSFTEDGLPRMDDDTYLERCSTYLKENVERYSEHIGMAYSSKDMMRLDSENRTSAILTIEDGRAVNSSFERLEKFYDMGVRMIALTWNYDNCLGHPNSFDREKMSLGLTDFGKEAVECMNHLGIAVDVSHLSDGGFWDVVDISKKPIIASHSNARALSPHSRNLTDEMIRAIANTGGVSGLNFCGKFLEENMDVSFSRVESMVHHLNYMKNVGGEDFVALGTDLDGIGGSLEIGRPTEMHKLFDALKKAGWSENTIEKLYWKNAFRALGDCIDK